MPQHGIELVELLHPALHRVQADAKQLGHLRAARVIVGKKLMQGRIQKTDVHGQAVHGGENAFEITSLHG